MHVHNVHVMHQSRKISTTCELRNGCLLSAILCPKMLLSVAMRGQGPYNTAGVAFDCEAGLYSAALLTEHQLPAP